jgi:hypothetical protein
VSNTDSGSLVIFKTRGSVGPSLCSSPVIFKTRGSVGLSRHIGSGLLSPTEPLVLNMTGEEHGFGLTEPLVLNMTGEEHRLRPTEPY